MHAADQRLERQRHDREGLRHPKHIQQRILLGFFAIKLFLISTKTGIFLVIRNGLGQAATCARLAMQDLSHENVDEIHCAVLGLLIKSFGLIREHQGRDEHADALEMLAL